MNPGGIATGLQRNFTPEQKASLDAAEAAGVFTYKTVEQGAATSIVAGVAPEFAHSGGHYLDDAQEAYTVPNDADLAQHPHGVRHGRSIPPVPSASGGASPTCSVSDPPTIAPGQDSAAAKVRRPIPPISGLSAEWARNTRDSARAQPRARSQVRVGPAVRLSKNLTLVREQHPRHGQIGGRIAGGEVTEVDHRTDPSVVDQNVGRVQISVQPPGGPDHAGTATTASHCARTTSYSTRSPS